MSKPGFKEESFKLKIIGKSGVFQTRHTHAVEYVQTSIRIHDLKYIEPVRRKFKKGELDFELMLQRDLDDERVKDEIIPYLKRDKKLSFFPPILVVILEIDKEKISEKKFRAEIKEFYPELRQNNNYTEDGDKYDKRDFGDLFSLKIFKIGDDLQRWFTELTVGHDATLLAIDGQHRLVALQAIAGLLEEKEAILYGHNADEFKAEFGELDIPITFIFTPDSHKGNSTDSLLSTFRQIFVDVNKNARTVTRMRNILLEEHDIRSIFTRMTCSLIRKSDNEDFISIDEIEWDKESKEFQLSNPTAITNLIFMKEIFDVWIQENDGGSSLKSFLCLDKAKVDLDETEYPYEDLRVDSYSYSQKKTLRKVFELNYQQGFAKLFSSIPFAMKRSALVKSLKSTLDGCIYAPKGSDGTICLLIRQYLFDGSEYKPNSKAKGVRSNMEKYLSELTKFDEEHFCSFIRTAMFQIAYMKLIKILFDLESGLDFKDFSVKFNEIAMSEKFLDIWQDKIINNRKNIEFGIKGNRNYTKGKSNTVYEFLKIIFKNNSDVFDALGIDWSKLNTNEQDVIDKFYETYESTFEEDNDKEKEKKLKRYKEFLSTVYLNESK